MIVQTKQGSATAPRPGTTDNVNGVIIAHLNNQICAWGAGFVLAVDDLSPIPKAAYQALVKKYPRGQCPLGLTQMLEIEPRLWVANMIAQNGIDKSIVPSKCLVDYNALQKCLKVVFRRAVVLKCDVHMPAGMGSGLAGGNKALIMDLINSLGAGSDILDLEQKMNFGSTVTLWEFADTSAPSYIAPADAAPVGDGDAVVAANKPGRGIDLSDDGIDLSEKDV